MRINIQITRDYRTPFWSALISTLIVAVLSELMLDGGETARLTDIALAAFWTWILFAMWRRPRNPTKVDLKLIELGGIPFVIAFQVAIGVVWHWRGLM